MKLLKPQPNAKAYYGPIQDQVEDILFTTIFRPLVDLVKAGTKQWIALNSATEALERALMTGRIQYADGVFAGDLSAAIGREMRAIGASFDARDRVYRIDQKLVPTHIAILAAQTAARARQLHDDILRRLAEESDRLDRAQDEWAIKVGGTVDRIYRDCRDIAREITIAPELSDQAKARLVADYSQSIRLPIKDWAQEQIETLRAEVEHNASAGGRFDTLIESVRYQYGTTQAKAKFLARQETGLFMAKFRREYHQDMGLYGYSWHARGRGLTRPSHWDLNNRIFLYTEPPIVDPRTGRRGNPGEDYGCLCVDRPVVGEITRSMVGQIRRAA